MLKDDDRRTYVVAKLDCELHIALVVRVEPTYIMLCENSVCVCVCVCLCVCVCARGRKTKCVCVLNE